jgi:hypothetical protein
MRVYEMMQNGGPVMWPLLACSFLLTEPGWLPHSNFQYIGKG